MIEPRVVSLVAECFWSGVTESDLPALDRRARAAAARVCRRGEPVRYVGSILMRADEVVLCVFEGSADAVARAARIARVPFERIVDGTHSFTHVPDHPGGGSDATT